jgi:hypothetical protein
MDSVDSLGVRAGEFIHREKTLQKCFQSERSLVSLQLVSIVGKIPKLFAVVILLCALLGCSGHQDIVGKWRTGDANEMVWEFSKNGAVLLGNDRGRYSFGDNKRIKIETPYAKSVYQMEISGDRMTLRAPSGLKLEFTRVKESTK